VCRPRARRERGQGACFSKAAPVTLNTIFQKGTQSSTWCNAWRPAAARVPCTKSSPARISSVSTAELCRQTSTARHHVPQRHNARQGCMRKALEITHHYAIVVQRPQRLPHNARKAEIPDLDFALHPQHSIMMEHQVSRTPSQCRLVRTPINGVENVIPRETLTEGREDRACSGPSPITRMLLGFRSRCIIQCCSKTSSSRTSDLLDLTTCLRFASLADTADPANRRFA